MLLLLHHIAASVCVLSVSVCVSAVATETVVGVAGQVTTLPCRLESVQQDDVEVCWGRGEPSLFTCHNTLINAARSHVTYRRSNRFSVSSSSSSLSISPSRRSDSGFYHCRVQVPGLFNDQTSTVHLIIITSPRISDKEKNMKPKEPQTTTSDATGRRGSDVTEGDATGRRGSDVTAGDATGRRGSDVTEGDATGRRGSDVTAGDGTKPMVALVQSHVLQEPVKSLQMFVGNTLRASFIVFLPMLLLSVAYRVWRSETFRRPDPSEEEEEEEGSSA